MLSGDVYMMLHATPNQDATRESQSTAASGWLYLALCVSADLDKQCAHRCLRTARTGVQAYIEDPVLYCPQVHFLRVVPFLAKLVKV